MPITAGLIAVVTRAHRSGLNEVLPVGALLSPTDPVLSSSVVTNRRVPRLIRHSLNPESGLNDGLALPAVLALTAAAEAREDFVSWEFVISGRALRVRTGIAVAFLTARLMPREKGLESGPSPHQKSMCALGVAFVAYGVAVLPPEGNGFVAVFVAAIAFGIWRPDIRECFERRSEDILEARGGRDDDLRPLRARLDCPGGRADRGSRRACRLHLGDRARADRHAGSEWMARRAEREPQAAAA